MNFHLAVNAPKKIKECLVIGIFSVGELPNFVQQYNQEHNNIVTKLLTKLHENGDYVWQSEVDDHSLFLIHCGKKTEFTPEVLNKRVADIVGQLKKQHIREATFFLPLCHERSEDWLLQNLIIQIEAQAYQSQRFKTKPIKNTSFKSITLHIPKAKPETLHQAIAITEGMQFAKELANLPANICTPEYLAKEALQLDSQHAHIHTKVYELEEITQLGMGGLLAVAQGSRVPPTFTQVHYQGAKVKSAPIVLVGKGITFDSGGLSLKPPDSMTEMKYDMTGAAIVLGVLKTCALLELPLEVIGLIPSAENMISGSAMKPGDVITMLSGHTVEVINTDAEGRLILADALTFAERFNPSFVLDVATLTGGIVVALGNIMTGYMTPDDALAEMIREASLESNDKTWRLPLDEAYQDALESPVADFLNGTFDRTSSSITAACFLSRFTKKYRWAHFDIAGTAWVTGKKRNATGRPLPLLIQLLCHVAAAS